MNITKKLVAVGTVGVSLAVATLASAWVNGTPNAGSASVTVAPAGATIEPYYSGSSASNKLTPANRKGKVKIRVTNNEATDIVVTHIPAGTSTAGTTYTSSPGGYASCPAGSVTTDDRLDNSGLVYIQDPSMSSPSSPSYDPAMKRIPANSSVVFELDGNFVDMPHSSDPMTDQANNQNGCLRSTLNIPLQLSWQFPSS